MAAEDAAALAEGADEVWAAAVLAAERAQVLAAAVTAGGPVEPRAASAADTEAAVEHQQG